MYQGHPNAFLQEQMLKVLFELCFKQVSFYLILLIKLIYLLILVIILNNLIEKWVLYFQKYSQDWSVIPNKELSLLVLIMLERLPYCVS